MRHIHLAAMATAMFISACGGGGGGGGDTSTGPPVIPLSTSVTVALSGTAAKGLMANADVNVYAANADGSVGSTSLASTTTKADGSYVLSFVGDKGKAYVITVSAKADGTTTHADEVSGAAQPLPAGFSMRALLVPASAGTVTTSASVTPFSELAVAAAAKASGGISPANAQQAISTVSQILGFDPRSVAVVPTSKADASPDEQKLAVLLASVSQLAGSGGLGCTSGSGGDKTRCVVNALASAASLTSVKLGTTPGGDASAALKAALDTVLTTPALAGTVGSAILTTVVSNLSCTTSCSAAATGTTPGVDATAVAITAAKLLFGEIKSDWAAMFSQGGASSIATGAANAQAFKFNAHTAELNQAVRTLTADSSMMLMGIDLYNDLKAGRTSLSVTSRGLGMVPSNRPDRFADQPVTACSLYKADATTRARTAADAALIRCSAYYYALFEQLSGDQRYTDYRHRFIIKPNADGSFGWQGWAASDVFCDLSCPTVTTNLQLDAAGSTRLFSGSIVPTLSSGDIVSYTQTGELPGGFAPKSGILTSDRQVLKMAGSRTLDAAHHDTSGTSTGSLTALDASGATLSTTTLKDGTINAFPVSQDSRGLDVAPTSSRAVKARAPDPGRSALDLAYTSTSVAFEGVITGDDPVWDLSLTSHQTPKTTLKGIFTTVDKGVATDFFTGTASLTVTGFGAFDASKPVTATNRYSAGFSFVGDISAPGRPLLELSLGAALQGGSHDGLLQSSTLQYRTLVSGHPRTVVNITGTPNATGKAIASVKLTEASANLSMSWKPGDAVIKLFNADTLEIGSLNTATGLVTFKDGSTMSLDIGL